MAKYLQNIRQYLMNFFIKEQRQEEQISKIEAYICLLYKLLIWEDVALSTFILIAVHILFWFVNNTKINLNTINVVSF